MITYCDESGYTGGDLLEKNQPYFVYSAIRMPELRLRFIKDFIYSNYHVQNNEIKGKLLVNSRQGQKVILEIFNNHSAFARVVYHDKKYAMAAKIVEYGIEPFLEKNYFFYARRLNAFIATGLYLSFYIKDDTAEALFNDFLLILRGKLKVTKSIFEKYKKDDELITWFLEIVSTDPVKVLKEIENEKSEVDKWILDLTMTSLLGLLSEWGKKGRILRVVCDDSKIFKNNPLFDGINNWGLNGSRKPFLGVPLGFRLKSKITNANSKDTLGLQIADLFASTVYYCLNNREQDFSKEILKIAHKNCLCRPSTFCVMPPVHNIEEEFGENINMYHQLMGLIYEHVKSQKIIT